GFGNPAVRSSDLASASSGTPRATDLGFRASQVNGSRHSSKTCSGRVYESHAPPENPFLLGNTNSVGSCQGVKLWEYAFGVALMNVMWNDGSRDLNGGSNRSPKR